jgi:outer membrane lipoprotein carrier protein
MSAEARSLTPLEGLEKLRQAFVGITDFSADIIQEKQLSVLRKKLVMKGIIRFRKPDRFMMVTVPPYSGITVLKDNLLEQRLGQSGELQRIVLPPEQGLKQWLSMLEKPVSKLPEGLVVRAEQQNGSCTILVLPSGTGQFKEIMVQLTDDGTLRRLVFEEKNGDRTSMSFSKFRKNTGLTESDFRIEQL